MILKPVWLMFLVNIVATNTYIVKFYGKKIKWYIVQQKCVLCLNPRIPQLVEIKLFTTLLLFQKEVLFYQQ